MNELQIIEQKGEAWRTMGKAIHNTEMQLQSMAQATLLKTTNPETVEDVVMAEMVLADMKKDATMIQFERKKITSKFDEVSARLMQPEKSLIEPIAKLQNQIIAIKKSDEVRVAKEQAKIQEKKFLTEFVVKETAQLDSKFKTFIADKVKTAYEFALGKGDIKFENVDGYIAKVLARITIADFTNTIKPPSLIYITVDEFNSILADHCNLETTPEDYVKLFETDLCARFSDYSIAVNNKQQALEIAEKEAADKALKQKEELSNKEAAASLASLSVSSVVSQEFKPLKQAWEISMEENPENAIKILAAVVGNWAKASARIGVKKWFQFSVQNAITCLEKLKNEDETFAPQGIVFKTYDKLK